MGKSGGGSNTSTSTSSPPPDVTAQYDNLIAQANAQSAQPLQQYQGQIVAGQNANQNQAAQQVQNAQGLAQPYYNQAQGLIQQGSQTLNPNTVTAADINQYQNPYTQNVINSTMANINQQNAGQQQQLIGNAAQQGAWGGDRSAVAQSLLANQQDLANNQTIAGLENQGYSQALGEANTQQQQANQAQQASQYLQQQGGFGLLNLGSTAQNQALNSANALNTIGGQQQQQTQEELNVPYEQFQQQQAYPYQNLSWLSSLSTGLGSNLGGTSTTTQPAPNSSLGLFGLKRGGAIPDGLIKRLAEGGAVMMPAHYDAGGIIPDVSLSYLPGAASITKGNGLPQPPKLEQPQSPLSGLEGAVGLASSTKGLLGGSGKSASSASSAIPSVGSGDNPLGLSSGSNFSPSDLSSISSDFGSYGTDTAASSAGSAGAADFFSSLGDSLMSFFNKGGAVHKGLIKHYDDGGSVSGGLTPFDTSTNPLANNKNSQYAQMPIEQLRELSARVQQPQQKQMIQQVLQQKQMMPNSGQASSNAAPMAPVAPQAGMASGGAAKYAFGGNVLPDIVSGVGDVVGAFFGDPGAGSQFTGALSSIDGGETKPGLQLSMLKRGGLIKGYDDGGDVPSQAVVDGDTLATPTTQPVNLIGANDSGGMSADNAAKMADLYPESTPSSGLVKQSAAPVQSASQSDSGFKPIPLPTFHDDKPTNEVNPWLSVLAGVAGAASGRSPYAIQNIAAGLEGGLKDYGSQKKEAADEAYKNGTIQDARDQLVRETQQYNSTGQKQADQFQQNLALDQKKEAAQEANWSAERANQAGDLAIKKQELQKPIFDKYGNPWQMKDGTYQRVDMAPKPTSTGPKIAGDPMDAATDILQQEGIPMLPVSPTDPLATKTQQGYQTAGQTAQSMLDILNKQKTLIGKYTSGPRGAANTSWLPSEAGLEYGSSELAAGNSDSLAARQEAEKDAAKLAMMQSSMVKGARPGVRMIQFSGTTVPNPGMSDKAQKELADEWSDGLKQQVQRGQVASMYSSLHPKNIDAILNNYETANPVVLSDGSKNTNWMPYKDWIKADRPDNAQPSTNNDNAKAASGSTPSSKTVNWVVKDGQLVQAP